MQHPTPSFAASRRVSVSVPNLLEAPRGYARMSRLTALACGITLGALVQAAPGLPFTESFDDTALRNDTGTRAEWGGGTLKLPTATPLQNPFANTTPAQNLPGQYTTRHVLLADMDGDGDLDLVEGASGRSGVYLNNGVDAGSGFFAARVDLSTLSANTRAVAVGDVDGDGDLDVATGNFGQIPRIHLNAGDGVTFATSAITTDPARETDFIVLVDVNGDGHLDAVEANHNSVNRIYLNTGDPAQPFGASGVAGGDLGAETENTQALAPGDVDNDGDVDFVALNEYQRNRLYLNQGDGTFTSSLIGTEADDSQGGVLGDLDGDGDLDLAVANSDPSQTSKIYFNNFSNDPQTTFTSSMTGVPFTDSGVPYVRTVVLGDADNDGDLDIFTDTAGDLVPSEHGNWVFFNDGTGNFGSRAQIGAELDITNSGAVGDVDGDGKVDYVAGNEDRDVGHVAQPFVNRLYLNQGVVAGTAVRQLTGFATSERVDTETAPITSVTLEWAPDALGAHNSATFWLSANGGTKWLRVTPGRPTAFPASAQGTDLRWRVFLSSLSPAATVGAAGLALDSVTITGGGGGPMNGAPAFTSSAVTTATVGTEYVYQITATDPNSDALTITGVTVPAWLTLTDNGAGGATLRGTPTAANMGANAVSIEVRDAPGATASQAFEIVVSAAVQNPPPTPAPPSGGGGSGGGGGSAGLIELLALAALALLGRRRLASLRRSGCP